MITGATEGRETSRTPKETTQVVIREEEDIRKLEDKETIKRTTMDPETRGTRRTLGEATIKKDKEKVKKKETESSKG